MCTIQRTMVRVFVMSFIVFMPHVLSGGVLADEPTPTSLAGPVSDWPRPIPIRVEPDGRDDLMITTLGTITTPLADGVYDPVLDQVTLNDGKVINDYYQNSLGIRYYKPIDKSIFTVPPSGWCSWYYYYQNVTPEEILLNARWIAKNLAPFGARYVQIDDGWQGTGHGLGENRDWTTIDKRFKTMGMKGLAGSIRDMGLEAGLWLAPHGQSNDKVARDSGAFLFNDNGESASPTWEGDFLLNPASPQAPAYLHDLFGGLHDWGFTYFKIDGQPIVINEYERLLSLIDGGDEGGENDVMRAAQHYRDTLGMIRGAIGEDSYLLGCWGIPLAGAGIYNGSRTAGDITPSWSGFLVANDAVQKWNYLHNIVWYSDPDVLVVRPPLTAGMARAWATIQGLSGQALLTSDRLPDLPPARVEILKRVYPAVDIRPLDLYQPQTTRKTIWDLKIAHQLPNDHDAAFVRSYDVVGLFNFSDQKMENRYISWESIGLDPNRNYHLYDYWQQTYLGSWAHGAFINIPPADVRVITLVPEEDHPVLVSTSRHITQGWIDVRNLEYGTKNDLPFMKGRSRVIADDPYTLTIGLPRAQPTYRLAEVKVHGKHPVDMKFASHQGYATVQLRSKYTQEVSWELKFEPGEIYVFPVAGPYSVNVHPSGLTRAEITWPGWTATHAAFEVTLDDQPIGVSFHNRALLRNLIPGHSYRVGVQALWWDGSGAKEFPTVNYTQPLPESLDLSEMEPEIARQDWGTLGRNRSVDGNVLQIAGVKYQKGIGTHARSLLRYSLFGAFDRFEAMVGIDDEAKPGNPVKVEFQVWVDGEMKWTSGIMRSGETAKAVTVDLTGGKVLELRVEPGDDGIDYDHADWVEARILAGGVEQLGEP